MPKTVTKNRSRENWKRNARSVAQALLVMVALMGAAYAVLLAQDATASARVFHLKEISFTGLEHLQASNLDNLIRKNFPRNVLSIDLERARLLIESEPWVREATVRRHLPDRLDVYVGEREPVAVAKIGKELKVVDREGVVLDTFGPDFSEELDRPIVKGLASMAIEGSDASNSDRMGLYLDALDALAAGDRDYATSLSEVDVTKVGRVRVVPTDEPVPVDLGDRDYRRRYEMFLSRLDLIQQVRKRHGGVEWVDMTFENRIVIHTSDGRETSESAAN